MSTLRPIVEKFVIEQEHWVGNGFRVRNYFPGGRNLLQRFSPYALMDYNAPKEFKPSTLIVLSGEPLNEPAVAGGPFVMNTREELEQAFQDYRDGKFGTEDF